MIIYDYLSQIGGFILISVDKFGGEGILVCPLGGLIWLADVGFLLRYSVDTMTTNVITSQYLKSTSDMLMY